ncbi:MAG: SIS domain-containing protein [Anaerolineae bacterium]|nr:SIS domain-containing protein [Anaerolineae bacterium]
MKQIDLRKIKTYPIAQRTNLVKMTDLVDPDMPPLVYVHPQLAKVTDHIVTARRLNRPVIWMMGGHVIKSGLSQVLIDLLRRGFITHVAGNGAVSIHDFELALIGETSEDVETSLADGSFGMAHETGALMHQAIREGVHDGLGYGASVGRFISIHPELFPYREISVIFHAYTLHIPLTIHVTIGADIIHQHPDANFTTIGTASGRDFKCFATTVCDLEGGVFLNFGSAVTGPEVFLKALTIARNLGNPTAHITTVNFDLLPLDDTEHSMGYDEPLYYYRPRKNIVMRPTALGGHGYHITGDHRATIPNLHHQLIAMTESEDIYDITHREDAEPTSPDVPTYPHIDAQIAALVTDLEDRYPALSGVKVDLLRAFGTITACLMEGGTLFLCGNGGSMSDALHISGELLKSYAQHRHLPEYIKNKLAGQPDGNILIQNLEPGLRAIVLGVNPALSSAVANDMPDRDVAFAQELLALAKPGDLLLGISTSGNARSVVYAAQTARALGLKVISLTGREGGKLAKFADIALRSPASRTDRVQEYHVMVYHTLCEMLEMVFFDNLPA